MMLSSATRKCSGVGNRGDCRERELAASTKNSPRVRLGAHGDCEEPARPSSPAASLWWLRVADLVSPSGRAVARAPRVVGTSGVWLFPWGSLMDGLRGCSLGAWCQSGEHNPLSVRQDQRKGNQNPESNDKTTCLSHTPSLPFFLLLFPANTENIIKSGVGGLPSCDWCVLLVYKTFSSLLSSV